MSKSPYHQSPDGLMRKCSNPPNCDFGTSVADHETMTPKEAEKANEKITAEQMAAEGKGTTNTVSQSESYKAYIQDIDNLLDDDTDMGDSFDIAEALYVHADTMSVDELDSALKHYHKQSPSVDQDGEFFIKEVYTTLSDYTESRRKEEKPVKNEDDGEWAKDVAAETSNYFKSDVTGISLLSSHDETDADGNAVTVITANKASFGIASEKSEVNSESDFTVSSETDKNAGKVVVSKKGNTFKAEFVSADGETEDLGGSRNPDALVKKAAKKLNPRSVGSKQIQSEDEKYAKTQKLLKPFFIVNKNTEDKVKQINAEAGKPGELSADEARSIVNHSNDGSQYGVFRKKAAQSKLDAESGNYSSKTISRTGATVAADGLSYSASYQLKESGRELTENRSAEVSVIDSGSHSTMSYTSKYTSDKRKLLPEEAHGISIPQKKIVVKESYELTNGNGQIVTTNGNATADFFAEEPEIIDSTAALWRKDRQLADEAVGLLADEKAQVTRRAPEKGTGAAHKFSGSSSRVRDTDELRKRLSDFVVEKKIQHEERPEGFRANSAAFNEDRNRSNAQADARNRVSDEAKALISRIDALNNRPLPRP